MESKVEPFGPSPDAFASRSHAVYIISASLHTTLQEIKEATQKLRDEKAPGILYEIAKIYERTIENGQWIVRFLGAVDIFKGKQILMGGKGNEVRRRITQEGKWSPKSALEGDSYHIRIDHLTVACQPNVRFKAKRRQSY